MGDYEGSLLKAECMEKPSREPSVLFCSPLPWPVGWQLGAQAPQPVDLVGTELYGNIPHATPRGGSGPAWPGVM